MFHSARLQLTLWYVLIIMIISMFFSVAIYKMLDSELQRALLAQRRLLERPFRSYLIEPQQLIDPDIVVESENRIKIGLGIVNLAILGASGGFAYFLAGKTLSPIETMVEEQNRFVADASHEIRTPLTSLKSTIEVSLRDKNLSKEEAKQTLQSSLDEINSLQQLSDNLLTLARAEPQQYGTLPAVSVPYAMSRAFEKVKGLAEQKKIDFIFSELDIWVYAEEASLIEVLVIIFDNAIKYSAEASTVQVTSKQGDNRVFISIADTGIGIAEHDLPHIFDRFYRSDVSRTKQGVNGYGLGLSIAKKIITDMQGSIQVSSMLGKGTTFTISLPMANAKAMQAGRTVAT